LTESIENSYLLAKSPGRKEFRLDFQQRKKRSEGDVADKHTDLRPDKREEVCEGYLEAADRQNGFAVEKNFEESVIR